MKKKSLFSRLMQKDYLLFLFALLVSMVIWLYMSFSSPNTTTSFTLSGVPIKIELSEDARKDGLQAFTPEKPTASVTLSGNRTVLGLVRESDLNVTAATGSINSVGSFTLPVTANKSSSLGNFTVSGCTPSSVNVTVDYLKEREIPIQEKISYEIDTNYYGSVTLTYNNLMVSGPQTEVMSISKVEARAEIRGKKLRTSKEIDAKIVLLDENDNEITSKLLDLSFETVKATITVMPEKQVKVEPLFVNKPEGLEITDQMLSVTPATLMLTGPQDDLSKVDSVQLEPVDFTELNNSKFESGELGIKFPENCKSIDSTTSAKFTLDLSGFAAKTVTVEKFSVEGLSDDYTSKVTSKSISVRIIGTKAEIEKLSESQITAVIDTSNLEGKTGSVEVPVTFRFNGVKTCWAFGSYKANITISKK